MHIYVAIDADIHCSLLISYVILELFQIDLSFKLGQKTYNSKNGFWLNQIVISLP